MSKNSIALMIDSRSLVDRIIEPRTEETERVFECFGIVTIVRIYLRIELITRSTGDSSAGLSNKSLFLRPIN